MKRIVAVLALFCSTALLAACGGETDSPASPKTSAPVSDIETAEPIIPAGARPSSPDVPVASEPAAPGAPSFAALYPDAVLDAPAVTASGAAGPGGLATYTTDADPDAVIAFHRSRAEAAGLSSANVMNQGQARAYGATSPDGHKNLQVVASATQAGTTSVQISWSAGR